MSGNEAQKRSREYDAVLDFDSPDAKKVRYDLFDILDETDMDPEPRDLESFMRSLEEEILLSSSSPAVTAASQPELGFLLEASDDDLGLPTSIAASGKVEEVIESLDFGCGGVGLGEIWGFEEADAAAVAEFVVDVGSGDGEYLALDGLFDYSDSGFGSTENSCQPASESMPAQ